MCLGRDINGNFACGLLVGAVGTTSKMQLAFIVLWWRQTSETDNVLI